MEKFHVNPETGNAGLCTAKTQCRFKVVHFDSLEDARVAAEKALTSTVKTKSLKKLASDRSSEDKLNDAWFNKSWDTRKEEIQEFTEKVISELQNGWLHDEEVMAGWVKNNAILAAGGRQSGQPFIALSETLKICNEKTAKETVIHEIAHVLVPSDAHGGKWLESANAVAKNVDPKIKYKFRESHDMNTLTPTEVQKYWELLAADDHNKFVGVCPNGHRNYGPTEPPRDTTYCTFCNDQGIAPREVMLTWSKIPNK